VSVLSRLLRRAGGGDGDLAVEPLRRRDLPAIEPIELASYPRPWSMAIFQSEIELARRGERTYVAARRDGELVGYAGQMYVVGEAHITNIATAPAHRRTGVATRLMAELSWSAIEHRCTAMTLEVRVSNTSAQELYRRFGFAPVGVRQKYYENVEDAIVMWCHDIAEPAHRARVADLCPEAARG
jgi:[ribosomal protein S18]-alanine N-acetyltransferase